MINEIPLSAPPSIIRLDRGIHGHRPVERFYFEDYWVLHLYHYECTIKFLNELVYVQPGSVTLIPPQTQTTYEFPQADCEHFYAILECCSEDAPSVPVQNHFSSGEITPQFQNEFRQSIDKFFDTPERSQAILWNLLWMLNDWTKCKIQHSSENSSSDKSTHRAVNKAKRIIQMDMRRPIQVSQIARECRISNNQLTRLFKASTGHTIAHYIILQRMKRAEYLLKNSSLSVKLIAQECGIPDLNYFNKQVRKYLGASPSKLRP